MQVSATPVEVPVAWNTGRAEVVNADGNKVALDAQAGVDRDITVDSWMWLGTLLQWNALDPTTRDQEVHLVKKFDSSADVNGREVARSVGLMRLRARV